MSGNLRFNPPPGWNVPAGDWTPPAGWKPDPDWPSAPSGWQFWLKAEPAPVGDKPKIEPPQVQAPSARSAIGAAETQDGASEDVGPTLSTTPAEPVVEPRIDEDLEALRAKIVRLEAEIASLRQRDATVELDDSRVLQEVGIYQYHHPLENAAAYKAELTEINADISAMVKARAAVLASDMFTYNNSLAQGRKMSGEFSKLMLRAYNAEADNCLRTLRAGNVVTAKRRLESCMAAVAKLGAMMEMRINPEYHDIRIRELELTADYLMKVQEEREAEREERARLREERNAEQELAAERARLDKEREHYVNALQALDADANPAGAEELAARLSDIDAAIEANDYRIANIRAGYVYVISNPGAFGPGVVKIGLTRRLDPMDRVRELGDASVPFPFDVHAMFFAEDAVEVEGALHRAFEARRVNQVNLRREFFFATPSEVREVLLELQAGNLLEFTDEAEATQYLQSKHYWPTAAAPGPAI